MSAAETRARILRASIAFGAAMALAVGVLNPAPRAAAETRLLVSELIVPLIVADTAARPRGVIYEATTVIALPAPLPEGATIWLAGSPDGGAPLEGDDTHTVTITDGAGRTVRWEHDYGDGQVTRPFGPVQVAAAPLVSPLRVTAVVTDTRPPRAGSQPVYLVVLAPRVQQAPTGSATATTVPPVAATATMPAAPTPAIAATHVVVATPTAPTTPTAQPTATAPGLALAATLNDAGPGRTASPLAFGRHSGPWVAAFVGLCVAAWRVSARLARGLRTLLLLGAIRQVRKPPRQSRHDGQ